MIKKDLSATAIVCGVNKINAKTQTRKDLEVYKLKLMNLDQDFDCFFQENQLFSLRVCAFALIVL